MKTYNFGTHWVTTDQELSGYIDCFEVTLEQTLLIEEGANLSAEGGILIIED